MHRVAAHAEEGIVTQRPGWGFISIYVAAYVGTWLALLTPIMVTLALRAREVAPGAAERWHSLVLAAGALFALVGNPVAGWLSDRTTAAWGMRRPWLVGGAIGGAASLWLVAEAPSPAWLVIGWCLAQLSFNAVLAPLAALLPDHVPASTRGTVSGLIGVTTPIGQVGGTYLARVFAHDMTAMVMIPAAVCLLLVLLLAVVLPDRRLTPERAARRKGAPLMRSLWVDPRKAPDFAWVCAGRFFLIMCMAFLLAYQPFFLMTRLNIDASAIPDVVFEATLVQSAAVVLAGLVAGRLSDITQRRRIFVIAAALACATGCGLISISATYETYLVAVAIGGLGLGAYLSVDLALVTDVLPNKVDDAARDLGLFNVASALPQSIAPGVASVILAFSAGGYGAVFLAAGGIGLLAALAVLPIRTVR